MSDTEFPRHARRAGLVYLGIILLGLSGELALRAPLIDWQDSAATATNIAAAPTRIALSIGFDLAMAALDVTLALLFLKMLRPVHAARARAATALRLIQAAILVVNALLLWPVTTATDPLPLFARHAAGYDLGLIFFAGNCLLMAWLLARTGRLPRLIPIGIAASGLVYLLGSLTRFLAPEINTAMQPAYVIPIIAETALALWLLFAPKARA